MPRKKKVSNDVKKTIADLQEVIKALLSCEDEGRECKNCKHKDENCFIFMRDSIAVALKFILDTIIQNQISTESDDMYA